MRGPPGYDLELPAGVPELIDAARKAEREARHDVARGRYVAALHRLEDPGHAAMDSALIRWIGGTHSAEGDPEAALDCFEAALAREVSGTAASGSKVSISVLKAPDVGSVS